MKQRTVFPCKVKKLIDGINVMLTIKNRLMLFFSILIILPLLAVSVISYFRFSSYAENITIKSKFDMSKSAIEEINIIKDRDERVSDQIILNKSMQKALYSQSVSDGVQAYEEKKSINSYLSSMTDSRNVSGIAVIGMNGKEYMTINVDLLSIKNTEDVKQLLSNPVFVKSKGNIVWMPARKNIFVSPYNVVALDSDNLYLYIVRRINKLENAKQEIGICIVQFVYDRLLRILKDTASGDGEYCIVTDASGIIMCHTGDPALIGTELDNPAWEKIKTGSEGSFYNSIGDNKYLMLFIKSKTSGWYIIQAVPQKNILEESVKIRNFTFITMFFCLLVALLLSVLFSRILPIRLFA